jgi:glutathione synthase/RimK-type ligase-like ATP-grasp enzyme
MILIITHKTDFTADFIINKLNKRKIAYKRFNCEDILSHNSTIEFHKELCYSILGEVEFNSVWFRRTKLPEIEGLPINERIYILNETDSLVKNIFSIIDTKWISDPFSVYKAENKLYQLKKAQEIGFDIPPTLITNSKTELLKFFEKYNQNVIVKPISQTRIDDKDSLGFIFTNILSKEQIENINNFDLTPCIYQKNIEKEFEVRVTVVENKTFVALIDSQNDIETKIDWRKKKLTFTEFDIPENVKDMCIRITKELNLKFGAIDLIKNIDGNYTFLEINPNGQWTWIEMQTNLQISEAIINALTNE